MCCTNHTLTMLAHHGTQIGAIKEEKNFFHLMLIFALFVFWLEGFWEVSNYLDIKEIISFQLAHICEKEFKTLSWHFLQVLCISRFIFFSPCHCYRRR